MTRKLLWKTALAVVPFFAFSDAWGTVKIQVNSTADEVDDDVTDGVCHTSSGTCTLRAAIMTANRDTFPTQIHLPEGVYNLSIPRAPGDDESNGDLNLTSPPAGTSVEIDIVGTSTDTTIIDGAGLTRVLNIDAKRVSIVSGLTIRNGRAFGDAGGGVLNRGYLSLENVKLVGNSSDDGGGVVNYGGLDFSNATISNNTASLTGGGIDNDGLMFLLNSTVSGNVSQDLAGGIYNRFNGELHVLYSTLDSNSAPNHGGGLQSSGSADIENATFSNNSAYDGGAIQGSGQLVMINTTIAGNHAANNGGGLNRDESSSGAWNVYNATIVYNDADSDADHNGSGGGIFVGQDSGVVGTLNIYNTLVAGNTVQESPQADDCSGSGILNTHANNLFGSTAGCPIVQVSGAYGQINSLGYLGLLADNGGATKTVALLRGSSAIDAGYSSGCFDNFSDLIKVDQRGAPRPVGPACDVGAYEYSDDIFKNGFD